MLVRVIIIATLAIIAVLTAGALLITRQSPSLTGMPPASPPMVLPVPSTTAIKSADTFKTIRSSSILGVAKPFTFSARVPSTWQAEAITATEAIALYDPTALGENNLEKSQIFIRYFTANDFLTLSTVTIHTRSPLTIGGHPAVRYDIEKKPTVADFPQQPQWRSTRHIVTDIRTSDQNPAVFYVIAKNPDLPEETFQQFLETLRFE